MLQAALREGMDFPHSCRVGGCAACKCKLIDGSVKELTESGYILSDDELDQGFILACQSVPKTDIRVEVDMASTLARRKVSGRVIAQDTLTHDIARLRIQLDETVPYKAGQFAQISIQSLPGVCRSYSFATPAQPDSQVSFFIRKVPGGVFSEHIHNHPIMGQTVHVEGPLGDFWLRSSDAPMLLVAGGSGLAPILALLHQALASGVKRNVTLLFGAREARDLYALDEINAIASSWPSSFRFVPVLSAADNDSAWQGDRGRVVDKIPAVLEADSHAYLCGPPGLIDSGVAVLSKLGVSRNHIHADRFTTQIDPYATAV